MQVITHSSLYWHLLAFVTPPTASISAPHLLSETQPTPRSEDGEAQKVENANLNDG